MPLVMVYGSRCKKNQDHKIQLWLPAHSAIYNTCSCGLSTSYHINKAFPEGIEHYEFFQIQMKYKSQKDYGSSIDEGLEIMNKSPEEHKVDRITI